MTKSELISAVAAKANIKAVDASGAIDALVAVIAEELAKGEKVAISGLGGFEVKDRAEREGVNPKTGAKLMIPASKAVGFKVAKAIKDILNA